MLAGMKTDRPSFVRAPHAGARGQAMVFIPCDRTVEIGRVSPSIIPPVELAILIHEGSPANIDLACGSLATYVTTHALAVEGPLREHYLVGPQDTMDESQWRTEIGWPIFQTG
jgi:effector-binding domain-containing protein